MGHIACLINLSYKTKSFMKSYNKYLQNVEKQILYGIFSNFFLDILIGNIKPLLEQDDNIFISYIVYCSFQEDHINI